MPNPTITSLLSKINQPDLLEKLGSLSSSELNSLLMEVFRLRAANITASDVMKAYQTNRFVVPSSVDPLLFAKAEVELLSVAAQLGFQGLELSPLAPLGNCSAIGLADQNKIVSALRGTEVVADATNLMALESSARRKEAAFNETNINLCAIHRHVRAQAIEAGNGFTPHFKIFCALTAGKDVGALEFEKTALISHLRLYKTYFIDVLKMKDVSVVIKGLAAKKGDIKTSSILYAYVKSNVDGVDLSLQEVPLDEHRYYQHTRFSLNVMHNGTSFNLGDGGFVDWGQKLTSNSKERMFTSGIGIELLQKLRHGMI
jgi:hypothetical protein